MQWGCTYAKRCSTSKARTGFGGQACVGLWLRLGQVAAALADGEHAFGTRAGPADNRRESREPVGPVRMTLSLRSFAS